MNLTSRNIAALHAQAQKALREGQPQQAHKLCLQILQADKHHADAWFLCGVIAGENGQSAKALEIIGNAVSLDPNRAEYLAEYGKYQLAVGQFQQALKSAYAALKVHPEDVPTLNTLGTLFTHCGEHTQAMDCFHKAVARIEARETDGLSRDNRYLSELYFNLAVSLQFSARIDEAETAFEKSIALQPAFFKAHSALSTLRRQSEDNNHIARLNELKPEVRTGTDQLHLGHALAREYEDLGRYEESLRLLRWAKGPCAAEAAYCSSSDEALFEAMRHLCPPRKFRSGQSQGHQTREPIFVFGMPRTGTTLVEQILGSHSQVFAAGELQNFPRLVKQLGESASAAILDEETLSAAERIDLRTLGQTYLDSTRPRTGHTPRFVDKLPLNFFYLGLIRQALPDAKLICLRRDPMDTCLSNYRQLFAVQFTHYRYNYDLLDCGRYYMLFEALISYWRSIMGDALYEVRYEELVASPAAEARKLLEYCELPWEEECLQFNTRKASVATPSAVQVRQPIYSSSVERWRQYGDALQPLYELLRDAGCYD